MARIAVEAWDPGYGPAMLAELEPTDKPVDLGVELPESEWQPLRPEPDAAAGDVVFVDGVQRADGHVWITEDGETRRGLCASYAAGVLRADGRATVEAVAVERRLFARAGASELTAGDTIWRPWVVATDDLDSLHSGVLNARQALEVRIAGQCGAADLTVLDGPLRGSYPSASNTIGYIKTHHVAYLPDTVSAVVPRLAPGERTPLFVTESRFGGFSWYLRLPGGEDHPWAGVVRCVTSPDLTTPAAVQLADRAAATLPRFASAPHKDRRAPQNLYPIAGLERELRHRMGDPALLLRRLRTAAAAYRAAP